MLDDKYTDGVWYDMAAGDYCRIVEYGDMREATVGLIEPDGERSDPYYTFDEDFDNSEDILSTLEADFYKVPDEAVENPVDFFIECIDHLHRGESLSLRGQRGFGYSRQQVEISEKSES